MAVQGIKDATIVLHGQTGCRKGLLGSQRAMFRADERDKRFYGGDNAIPYSNIRPEDYYRSTLDRLEDVFEHVSKEDYALKVLMCSPGISMIGDDCRRAVRDDDGFMLLDTDRLSDEGCKGFDECLHDILEYLDPAPGDKIERGVNLIGLSIMHKDWYSFCHEFSHLLKDAGFEIVCVLGAGCSVDDIRNSINASYNIVIDPAYCETTADLYEEKFGIPSISIGRCPIGFDAIEDLFKKVEETTGVALEHGMSMMSKCKKRAYDGIRVSGKNLRGKTFGIIAEDTAAEPLREFLISSFGMVESYDLPDYLFAPGNIAMLEERAGRCGRGVDIGFPSSAGPDFLKKPLMGLEGVMYILDALFNRPCGRTRPCEASSPGCAPDGCPCR